MRSLALHAMTGTATLLLLVLLAVPAKQALDREASDAAEAAPAPEDRFAPAQDPRRLFGVYVDPWHVDEWASAIGAAPQAVAKFQAFASNRPLGGFLDEAARKGLGHVMLSWEPWAPVPSSRGVTAQARPQPGYRNVEIARGSQDRYLTSVARELALFPGTVYLRYAHEMNGYWYPWSHDARAYRWAWRRMVRLFRTAGARNVRFVWSVNPNLYESAATWRAELREYWPGKRNVDLVGTTMIDFGGAKDYPVGRFIPRLRALHHLYRKPVVLAETNTELAGADVWLGELRDVLGRANWIRAVFWSQLPSRGKVQQSGTGIVDWNVTHEPAAAAELRAIIGDGAATRDRSEQ